MTILTWIGIYGLLATLVAAWLYKCFITIRSGEIAIVGEWGANACDIKTPGLRFVCWPFYSIMEKVTIITRTINLPRFTVNTLLEDAGGGRISFKSSEIVPLTSGEISVKYHLDFEQRKFPWGDRLKLREYFKMRSNNGFNYGTVEEIIKDKAQSYIREVASRLGALTVMSWPKSMTDEVQTKLVELCDEQHIPVAVTDLKMNTPFTFANPEHAKAVAAKATAVLRFGAVDKEQDVLELEADRQIQIKRKQGEAEGEMEKVKLRKLFEAYGIDTDLPPPHRFVAKMHVVAIRAYEEMARNPNKTFHYSTSIMNEIRDMLSGFARQ